MVSNSENSEWGLCKDCKWWQIEPKAPVADKTMGLCIEESLQPFRVRVSGNSGCNLYAGGTPARAKLLTHRLLPSLRGENVAQQFMRWIDINCKASGFRVICFLAI
jgi:hypothetical protein